MMINDFDIFMELAKTLAAAGWVIVKFENLGGGATLTIVPQKQETAEAE
jgi:hypothetical protein